MVEVTTLRAMWEALLGNESSKDQGMVSLASVKKALQHAAQRAGQAKSDDYGVDDQQSPDVFLYKNFQRILYMVYGAQLGDESATRLAFTRLFIDMGFHEGVPSRPVPVQNFYRCVLPGATTSSDAPTSSCAPSTAVPSSTPNDAPTTDRLVHHTRENRSPVVIGRARSESPGAESTVSPPAPGESLAAR